MMEKVKFTHNAVDILDKYVVEMSQFYDQDRTVEFVDFPAEALNGKMSVAQWLVNYRNLINALDDE